MGDAHTLALVNIDGTVLFDNQHVHDTALADAACQVYGVKVGEQDFGQVNPLGKTDLSRLRAVLNQHGIENREVDRKQQLWVDRAGQLFGSSADESFDLWTVRRTVKSTFSTLNRRGVHVAPLTAGLRSITEAKLRLMEVDDLFDLPGGAYGSDLENRNLLPALARSRSGRWDRSRTWLVGGCEADLIAARNDQIGCVLLHNQKLSLEVADLADRFIQHLHELTEILSSSRL